MAHLINRRSSHHVLIHDLANHIPNQLPNQLKNKEAFHSFSTGDRSPILKTIGMGSIGSRFRTIIVSRAQTNNFANDALALGSGGV